MPTVIRQKHSGDRVPVEVNSRGQYVSPNGKMLQSYIGVLVRQTVPISCEKWSAVSQELKDKIWEQVKVKI